MHPGQKFRETWYKIASLFCYGNFLFLNTEWFNSKILLVQLEVMGMLLSECKTKQNKKPSFKLWDGQGFQRSELEKQFMTFI